MKLALAQIRVEAADVAGNVDRAEAAIERAAARGVDLVALPELFNVGYFAFDLYARNAEGLDGETLSRLSDAALDNDVAVLAGSIVEDLGETREQTDAYTPAEDGLANTAVLFDAEGERQLVYRKHHLFGYESAETGLLTAGERLPVTDLGGFTVGVTTCYDLRFPEQYRELLDRGADLVLVPSAWPYPRVEHWQTLPRARAIENLSYVATINGSADFEDATLVGRSTLFDPWGTPVATTDDRPDVVYAEADPDEIARVRDDFPALDDRR
ncbi:nitrilase-related carbon-nitrogen hydrolase [Haloarchaeobius amylolyticus]|uniref:nitrilase-related carbon-nitrogen hydrolase n=1 Tax=Haloarchaeobius amylolyticus TaxID=1198296 RepID=UPI00226D4A7F|nr:nitrilase-related carbon-nitrogen hydrolase [Haloarchaeobius amylolyticus]